LEHVTEPLSLLNDLKSFLAPEGQLLLIIPVEGTTGSVRRLPEPDVNNHLMRGVRSRSSTCSVPPNLPLCHTRSTGTPPKPNSPRCWVWQAFLSTPRWLLSPGTSADSES